MLEVGRMCIKTAGREAGKRVVIVDKIDDNYVLIDGEVKRKKCNISHLEPLDRLLKIKQGAGTTEVLNAMQKAEIEVKEKISGTREALKSRGHLEPKVNLGDFMEKEKKTRGELKEKKKRDGKKKEAKKK